MSKTHYELTVIIDAGLSDDEQPQKMTKIKDLITAQDGEITIENELGRRKLSYPIKKSIKGNFISLEFDLEPENLKKIEKELQLDKDILRFLNVKKPRQVNTQVRKDRVPSDKKEASSVAKKDISPSKEDKKEKLPKVSSSEKTEKSDINELDKKLDEILNDEIIN